MIMKKKLPLSNFQKNSVNAQQLNQLKGGINFGTFGSSFIAELASSTKYISWGEVDIRTGGDAPNSGINTNSINLTR